MSNPSVFELNRAEINGTKITIEDNIGEAIHFHIGMIRFDLTIKEFNKITQELLEILNDQSNIPNFNLLLQNEFFLERIAKTIPYIEKVEEKEIDICELKYRYENLAGEVVEEKIFKTPIYRYFCGEKDIIKEYEIKRDIFTLKEEAIDKVMLYPNENIFIDENNFILDGYKTVCYFLAKDRLKMLKVKKIVFEKGIICQVILNKEKCKW